MKYFNKNALFLLMLLMVGNYGANACELPAHPSATAMPVPNPNIRLVPDGSNKFYYLVPEGTEVKMKVLWDPYCHNSGSNDKAEEYEGVIKEDIPIDPEIGKVNDYGFFALGAMSQFFFARGNRNDLSEAFYRETGMSESTKFVPDNGLGPELALSIIFLGSPEIAFTVKGEDGNATGYSDNATIKTTESDLELSSINGLNELLPSTRMHEDVFANSGVGTNDVFELEGGVVRLINTKESSSKIISCRPLSDNDYSKLIQYSGCGFYLGDMKIELEEPQANMYKAYIMDDGKTNKVEVKNIKWHEVKVDGNVFSLKNDDVGNGDACGPEFTINFSTPSLVGKGNKDLDSEKSTIKIMVNSPAAGYRLSKVFWVWEETVYEQITSGEYELAEGEYPHSSTTIIGDTEEATDTSTDTDTEDDTSTETDIDTGATTSTTTVRKIDAGQDGVYVYKKLGKRKCSVEAVMVYSKAQDGKGYSAYRVYDNSGPISSKLTVSGASGFEETDNGSNYKTTFNFTLNVLDSNPYFSSEFNYKSDSNDYSQKKENMKLAFYYNYPVYDYTVSDITKLEDLSGYGLVDFANGNEKGTETKFKGYKHKTYWMWKKVDGTDITIDSINSSPIKNGDFSIGSNTTISGKFTIKNPKPWHEKTNISSTDHSGNPDFSVFALFKDSSGKTHLTDGDFLVSETKTDSSSAKPNDTMMYAVIPNVNSRNEVSTNTTAPNADTLASKVPWVNNGKWQEVSKIKSEDKTAPEIQVIVYDTRTNKYHIFGSAKNTAAAFTDLKSKVYSDYSVLSGASIPYINKNTAISNAYKYVNASNINDLFTTYLNETGNAVTTVFDETKKNCFVCQKNTRLVFTVHAFDNINYQETDGGLSTFKATLTDLNGNVLEEINSINDRHKPLQSVLRLENVDDSGNLTNPYKLIINATDEKGNARNFELDIAVIKGDNLDIRTLGEKRQRID